MVRAGLGLAAMVLAGCAQILGLDEPAAADGTGSGDVGSGGGSGGAGTGSGTGSGSGSGAGCRGVVFDSLCYELVSEDVYFGQAIDMCRAMNGTLAKVESANLESVLGDMVPLSKEVFLGATADMNQPGMFRWLDGTLVTFLPWLPSQPDGMSTEPCIAIQNAGQIGWEDVPCGEPLDFFCAYPM